MGWQVSPIVSNLYMEYFERKALRSASNPPQVWFRFVDHTWVIQQQDHKQTFLDHINSIDPAIKFTVGGTHRNGAIPFLDTLITPQADNSLSITVYQKPTHTDQYLQWDSHHSLSAKYSVTGTLTHRAKTVCTGQELLQRELWHLRKALVKCKYLHWAINRVQSKFLNSNWEDLSNSHLQDTSNNPHQQQGPTTTTWGQHQQFTSQQQYKWKHRKNNHFTGQNPPVGYVVIPYTQG